VKIKTIIPLAAMLMLLTACPETEYTSPLSEIQKNKMDFPDLEKRYYQGINYKLSKLFERSYYDEFVIKDQADVFAIYDMSLYFGIEVFDRTDVVKAQYEYETEVEPLRAIHDMYAGTRAGTINDPKISILRETPESVGYPGLMQVISGGEYEGSVETSYFMATLEINGNYYVFQLIGKKENMGYLHDDFIELLSSVEA
jgi:hypothetical protein